MKTSQTGAVDDEKEKIFFILEQAKEYLQRTLVTSDQLENKATILLGFTITIMIGIVAYFITQYSQISNLILPIIVYLIALLVCSICLFLALVPSNYYGEGSPPDRLLKDEVWMQDSLHFISQEVDSYTVRIEKNEAQNKRKAAYVTAGTYVFMLSPILVGTFMAMPFIICKFSFWLF